jgi:enoyl-[acyl-carrier protein] reductase II
MISRDNRIKKLFDIEIPLIQAGMIWCSGWRLASAVSNSGGLGLIGAGSMHPDVLREHIQKCQAATRKPFGVNIPLLYPEIEKLMEIVAEQKVKIVFTSAGNPATWTSFLKERNVTVVHVVSSSKFARKAEQSGVDAIVAEGHNGREETTTFVLLPLVRDAVSIPLIAAGGIGSGRAILAAEALGADGVQIGSRFAVSIESSAHEKFKQRVIAAEEGDTMLALKQLTPVRMIKNEFYKTALAELLGKRRAKKGMFEGNLDEGELEIGQISAGIDRIQPASEILTEMWEEYVQERNKLCP